MSEDGGADGQVLPAGMAASLTVVRGPDSGARVSSGTPKLSIGRKRGDLLVSDRETSGLHASIERGPDGQFVVRDLGSTNGTFLDGRRVTIATIASGQQLKCGANYVLFTVSAGDDGGETRHLSLADLQPGAGPGAAEVDDDPLGLLLSGPRQAVPEPAPPPAAPAPVAAALPAPPAPAPAAAVPLDESSVPGASELSGLPGLPNSTRPPPSQVTTERTATVPVRRPLPAEGEAPAPLRRAFGLPRPPDVASPEAPGLALPGLDLPGAPARVPPSSTTPAAAPPPSGLPLPSESAPPPAPDAPSTTTSGKHRAFGADLPASPADAEEGLPEGVEKSPYGIYLVVERGRDAGLVLPLCRETTVLGRSETDVVIDDADVSRRHAAVDILGEGKYILRDLASTNGTLLNGIRVRSEPIANNDKIRVGGTTIKFVVGGGRLAAELRRIAGS